MEKMERVGLSRKDRIRVSKALIEVACCQLT